MKKLFVVFFAAMLLLGTSGVVSAERPIRLRVGGKEIKTDVAPVLINGRTLVPVRAIFESLDANVIWDESSQTVTAKKEDTEISLKINSNEMTVNGKTKTLEVPAQLISGRTMVPVRAASEAFGNEVIWNEKTRTVKVKKGVWVRTLLDNNGIVQTKFTYGENGNNIYSECSNGSWTKSIYDEDGRRISKEDSDGFYEKYTFTENGDSYFTQYPGGYWVKTTYDEHGNLISTNNMSRITRNEYIYVIK